MGVVLRRSLDLNSPRDWTGDAQQLRRVSPSPKISVRRPHATEADPDDESLKADLVFAAWATHRGLVESAVGVVPDPHPGRAAPRELLLVRSR